MKLASGVAPVPKLLDAGICVGLGTDGCASNNNLDMFSEMDVAAKLHKVYSRNPTVIDARCVVQMATVGGARAIGLGDITGSLEVGKEADLIIIDTNRPHLVPMYHPASHIVYAVTGSDVRDVIIGGRVVLRNRKVLTINVDDLLAEVQCLGKKIKEMPA
jgi:5-methylthioadenosine/S-adenosylhomocysteine deaminase